jgi:hypothetical protein
MDFMVNHWGAAMVGVLFLAAYLVGAPLPSALVGDIWIRVELPAMDFLARPA